MESATNSVMDGLQSGGAGIAGIAVLKVQEPLLKRPLDLILSLFMMILSAPFSLIVALAIKLEDGGPVLYRKER